MKTKINMASWLLALVLAFGVMSANAQSPNQNSTQSVCVGDQPYNVDPIPGASFTWTLSGGGTISSGAGTNAIVVTWTTVGGPYTLSVTATLDGCTGPAQSVDVTVVDAPVGPTLAAKTPNTNEVCAGTLVSATFNEGSGGVGCGDEFEYSFDGDGNWLAYTAGAQLNTDGHTMVEIRGRRACDPNYGCGVTEWVVLASWTVNTALPLSVLIEADPNPVCEGSSVTFTATVTNGGIPTYAWYVNGTLQEGEILPTFTYVPANGDIVKCEVISSEPCATGSPAFSNEITVITKPVPTTSGIWHN